MAKQIASVALSGGDGFNYEDRVAARFMVDMLAGIPSFGMDFGNATRIDWQARDAGRLLDDLVVTLSSEANEYVAECSIKSDRQVTSGGYPSNFVEAAWEQWLHAVHSAFKKDRDILVLVVGELANEVQESWTTLLRQSLATTNDRFLERHKEPIPGHGSQSSETARSILESLHCPARLQTMGASGSSETVDLLRRIRLLHFDFETASSRDLARALSDCQLILSESRLDAANRLWDTLVSIASEHRGRGGTIDLASLLKRIRPFFQLLDHPDFHADWKRLKGFSSEFLSDTRSVIGNNTTIDRDSEIRRVSQELTSQRVCLIAGESGTGKSAISKAIATTNYNDVVALIAEDCDVGRLIQLDEKLGISHPFVEVLGSSRGNCLLILDALERFSDQGLKIVGKVIRDVIADSRCDHVHILLVCQSDSVQRLTPKLTEAGVVQSLLAPVQISGPSESTITTVLQGLSGISWAALNIELRPLLRNLKILDWVVRATQSGQKLDVSTTIGLISLIDYLWNQWIEGGERGIAGGGLLKKIASIEATNLSSGVLLTELHYAELVALAPMMSADLLKRKSERIMFSHDLLGDWARLRILIGADPTHSHEGIHRAASPRWHRAVRLFGQWMLSQNDGVSRWTSAIRRSESFSSDQGTIVRDQLLDAIALSENAISLFGKVLQTFCENDGKLLKQFLDRFLFVATFPDLRLIHSLGTGVSSPKLEASFRIPIWPYWGAVLAALHIHLDAIRRFAPGETVRICKLWLEKVPPKTAGEEAYPFRNHAAAVALAIAKDIQVIEASGKHPKWSIERTAYQAALLAASDLPDEVASFALEMANRKPLTDDLKKQVDSLKAADEEAKRRWEIEYPENAAILSQLGVSSLPMGEWIGPWPDGPSSRITHEFQGAVFDGTEIVRLAEVRPEAAFEVLLACCIEAPHHENPYGSDIDNSFGLESYRDFEPVMYFRGPFLRLFRSCNSQAVEFAIKLVNFATVQWADHERKLREQRGEDWYRSIGVGAPTDNIEVVVLIAGTERTWLGGRRVLRWYLDWPDQSKIITCVLMALEKYIYEQLDDGIDLGALLTKIIENSRSTAFAGVLIDIGKRNPELFQSHLRPLLGTADFYLWEQEILVERSSDAVGMIGWWNQPEELIQVARDWHLASYRKHELRQIAIWYMLSDPEMNSFFSECKSAWERASDEGSPSNRLLLLIAQLDRSNYRQEPQEDGRTQYTFVIPESLAGATSKDTAEANTVLQRMGFPSDCRKILDGEKSLPREQCDAFLQTAVQIESLPTKNEDDDSTNAAVISGTIAVLANWHLEWLLGNPDKMDWCLEQLGRLCENPPKRRQFDMPESPGGWEWDCFISEAAVGLLREFRDKPLIRELVAVGIAAFRYETTEKTMKLAHRYRESLGDVFELMQQLAIRWSLVRCQHDLCKGFLSHYSNWKHTNGASAEPSKEEIELLASAKRWQNEYAHIIEGYVKGTLSPRTFVEAGHEGTREAVAILDVQFPARRKGTRLNEHRHRRHRMNGSDRGIDGKVISSAFAWLSSPLPARPAERREIISKIQNLMHLTMNSLVECSEDDDDEEMLPGDFEGWVFGIASQAIVAMEDHEDPSALWKPILSLDIGAHHWIEDFFWQWFTDGVRATNDVKRFCDRWSEMIEYALSSQTWNPDASKRHTVEDMVFELMGFHFGIESVATDQRFAKGIESMSRILDAATQKWLTMPRVVNGFAESLSRPGYSRILIHGIQWLHRAMPSSDDYDFWREDSIDDNLINVLHQCWETCRESVCSDRHLQDAFLGLLTALSSRGNHSAMSLKDRLLNSISNKRET